MANDTAALVVALSAQLTKFERDMKQAGNIADRTVADIEGRENFTAYVREDGAPMRRESSKEEA
ncbi:hypothetical protein [Bradyrhizobium sp. LA6.12]|uniref:hypothetical protein n=1 Tax=unclassified Bradyrhizobium TaxID=2631580 RepID=UPI003398FD5D